MNRLPEVTLEYSVSLAAREGGKYRSLIEIGNPSSSLAFAVNPKILRGNSGDLVLLVFWDDNYFSLLPGEKRALKVEFNADDLGGEVPLLSIDGWNIRNGELELK